MFIQLFRFVPIIAGVLLAFASDVSGQAYCALRDPVDAVQMLYPENTHFRSIVKKIDVAEQEAIAKRFPFSIHRNELGSHTIYVVFKNDRCLGIVHVRSEQSKWGLIEIAWAIDSGLSKVSGFHMQRCRNPLFKKLDPQEMQALFRGKGTKELINLVSDDGRTLRSVNVKIPSEVTPLVAAMVRSSVKTLVVTRDVYREEIVKVLNQKQVGTN